jgi:hypothetical protein
LSSPVPADLGVPYRGDRGFESVSLQRRVSCELDSPGFGIDHDSRRLQPRWDPTFSEHSYRFRRKLARVDSSTDVLMMFYDRGTSSERHG